MIKDGNKWHYLSVKRLPKLLRGIMSKNNSNYYYVNCLHSSGAANKLKSHEGLCKDHDYCQVKLPEAHNNILKFNHEQKSLRIPFFTYADTESLLEKISTCDNNPKESYTTKINKHVACGYPLFTHCLLDSNKNKRDFYRSENPVEKICAYLRKHATEIINCRKCYL